MTDKQGRTTNATVTVSEQDTLPDVLNRIRAADGQSVTLEIPEHSPIFLTATEFRTLRDIAERAGVTLNLVTEDQLRLQLASMFGLANFARPSTGDDGGNTDSEMESTPSFSGWRAARAKHTEKMSKNDAAEDPIAVSRRRRSELYEPGMPADKAGANGNVGLSEDASLVSLSYLDDDGSSAKARMIGRIVAVVAVLALVAGIAGWFYLPSVTVEATLRQGQISTELLYSVTRPGAKAPSDAAFSVEAEDTSANVAFDITVPATGRQATPDKTATGTVTLRNASTDAVAIPVGTTLTTAAGVSFVTNDEVEVPPGSPDGSTIGEIEVEVTAAEAGSGGNLGVGELSGKVPDQPVYFSNRNGETSGGTDIEVVVVTEEDIANLENQVESDLRRAVAEDWTAQLAEGQVILTPSVEVGTPDYRIEQQVGDVSDTVTLTGTVDATGFQYDGARVMDQARASYESALVAKVPEGYELVPDSMTLGEPQLVSEAPESVEYTMTATATVRAKFDEATANRLADDLAGSNSDEVESILSNVPAFETYSVSHSPGWWFDRMPQTADRITVDIADAVPLPVVPDGSTPEATPTAGSGS